MYMILITYMVTVIKCVAGAAQTTEQRTRRNEGENREGVQRDIKRVSTVALLLWGTWTNHGVFWSITLPKTSDAR